MSLIDELYYGKIIRNENRNRRRLPYEKAVRTFSDIESKLTKELNGENLKPPVNNSLLILERKLILFF